MDRFEKEKWNDALHGFSNPMSNLFDLMKTCVANMGVSEYYIVLEDLKKAEELMRHAVDNAGRITYELPPIKD